MIHTKRCSRQVHILLVPSQRNIDIVSLLEHNSVSDTSVCKFITSYGISTIEEILLKWDGGVKVLRFPRMIKENVA